MSKPEDPNRQFKTKIDPELEGRPTRVLPPAVEPEDRPTVTQDPQDVERAFEELDDEDMEERPTVTQEPDDVSQDTILEQDERPTVVTDV